jgi:hypothetical protein
MGLRSAGTAGTHLQIWWRKNFLGAVDQEEGGTAAFCDSQHLQYTGYIMEFEPIH